MALKSVRQIRGAAGVVACILAAALLTGLPRAASATTQPYQAPVLFVHGVIASAGCPGEKADNAVAPFAKMLRATGWTGPVLGVAYYCGDTGGAVIRNEGGPSTPQYPTNGYNATTPIERLGLDLAWFIYNTYTVRGQAVDILAHSMGGLITRSALAHVATLDPAFPPSLLVDQAVTLSTPYAGIDKAPSPLSPAQYSNLWCGSYVECKEMVPGSPFLTSLHAITTPLATDWTTEGGGPKDIMTYASSADLPGAHKINYFAKAPVNYGHTAYLTDTSTAKNEPYVLTEPDGTSTSVVGNHSLAAAVTAMRSATA